jgi:hypothetical protein
MRQTGVAKKGLNVKEKAGEKCEGTDRYVWETYIMIYESLKCRDEDNEKRQRKTGVCS